MRTRVSIVALLLGCTAVSALHAMQSCSILYNLAMAHCCLDECGIADHQSCLNG